MESLMRNVLPWKMLINCKGVRRKYFYARKGWQIPTLSEDQSECHDQWEKLKTSKMW